MVIYDGSGLTLLMMQDEVCRRCFKDTSTFRTMVTNWINEAQQKISSIANGTWWWLEKSQSFIVSAGDDQISLPIDFFEMIDADSVQDTTNAIVLKRIPHGDFVTDRTDQQGQPDRYCIFSQDENGKRILQFDPPSDGTRTIVMDYFKVLPDLEDDTDVSLIPYWYHYLLIEFGVMRGHEHRQQDKMAQLARANWLDGINQLMVEADRHNDYQPRLSPKWR